MHLGWVHKYGNYYTAQLAVYAKPRGDFGEFYMQLIMPFRRVIVYPTMMEEVKKRWEAYNKISRQQSIEEWEKKTFIKQPPEKVMGAAGIKIRLYYCSCRTGSNTRSGRERSRYFS
jgi:hypothetical protein